MEGVNCKNRSHECAAPDSASPVRSPRRHGLVLRRARTARELREQEKKKGRCRAVQQHIHKMMRTRLQTEKLTIQHVRHGRERMPIMGMDVGERPSNALPAQSGTNVVIFADVNRVVEVDEVMADRLAENRPRNRDQRGTNREFQNELGAHNFGGIKFTLTGVQTSCRSCPVPALKVTVCSPD